MPRIARIVVPGYPHHVTQQGNRRQPTFFGDEDYELYRKLMAHWCTENRVAVWAYCLMPNHVHLVLVPSTEDGLRLAYSSWRQVLSVCLWGRLVRDNLAPGKDFSFLGPVDRLTTTCCFAFRIAT